MARIRVPLHGTIGKSATIDTDATRGAQLGVDLYWNGRLLDPREILNAYAPSGSTTIVAGGGAPAPSPTPGGDLTTDDVYEGSRKYFTAKRAQDAAGAILANTANVTLAYDGTSIKADLTATAITAGNYGTAAKIVLITFDAFGRAVAASEVDVTPAWGNVTGTLADQTDLQAALDAKADAGVIAGVNAQTSTTYTLTDTDAGKLVACANGAAVTVTVPAGTLPAGAQVLIAQTGAGQVTLSGASGVTLSGASGLSTRAQHSVITLVQTGVDEWLVFGDAA